MHKRIIIFLLLIQGVNSFSQDLSNFSSKDLLGISGSVGASGTFYHVEGIDPRRDPFFWQLNANLNINTIGGINIPFSMRLTQQEKLFSKPTGQAYNQIGLSPKYKFVTAHLGYRSLKLSEFSLSGNQFFGVGVEIAPENSIVSGKLVYGRFARAVDGYYQDGMVIGTPAYERWGAGAMISLGKANNNFGLVFFKAKDDPASLTGFEDDVTIRPADNLVYGITTKQKVGKNLSFDGEIDWSAYTNDIRLPLTVLEGYSYINNLGVLFTANSTTSFKKAMYGNLKYKFDKMNLKLGYRRVDPEYRTMGSVYLNNDFEDATVGLGYKFLNNKLNVNGSGGLQRNNLDDNKMSGMRRIIGSLAANYSPSQTWNFSANFSNFNSVAEMTLITSFDTLRYAQVSKNAGVMAMYNKIKNENRLTVSAMSNYQIAKINGIVNTEFYNVVLAAQYGLSKIKTNVSLSLSANKNVSPTTTLTAVGPTLGLAKSVYKNRVKLKLSSSILQSYSNGVDVGFIYNNRFSAKYKIDKRNQISSNISFAKREDPSKAYSELIATIGYNYTF